MHWNLNHGALWSMSGAETQFRLLSMNVSLPLLCFCQLDRSSLRTKRSEVWQSVLIDCFTMFAMTISHTVKIVSRSECYLVIALDCLRWITEGNGDVDNDENLDLVQSSTFSFSNFFHCWKSYKKARKKYASAHWPDARPAFFWAHRTPSI